MPPAVLTRFAGWPRHHRRRPRGALLSSFAEPRWLPASRASRTGWCGARDFSPTCSRVHAGARHRGGDHAPPAVAAALPLGRDSGRRAGGRAFRHVEPCCWPSSMSTFRARPAFPSPLCSRPCLLGGGPVRAGRASLWLLTTVLLVVLLSRSLGRRPVSTIQLAEGVLALQSFSPRSASPLLLPGRGDRQREPAEQALRNRCAEGLLRASRRLRALAGALDGRRVRDLAAPARRVPRARSRNALPILSRAGRVSRGLRWSAPGMAPVSRVSVIRDFPWLVPRILREQRWFSRLEALPAEAMREAETFRRRGVRPTSPSRWWRGVACSAAWPS